MAVAEEMIETDDEARVEQTVWNHVIQTLDLGCVCYLVLFIY